MLVDIRLDLGEVFKIWVGADLEEITLRVCVCVYGGRNNESLEEEQGRICPPTTVRWALSHLQ